MTNKGQDYSNTILYMYYKAGDCLKVPRYIYKCEKSVIFHRAKWS